MSSKFFFDAFSTVCNEKINNAIIIILKTLNPIAPHISQHLWNNFYFDFAQEEIESSWSGSSNGSRNIITPMYYTGDDSTRRMETVQSYLLD